LALEEISHGKGETIKLLDGRQFTIEDIIGNEEIRKDLFKILKI